MKKMLCTGLSYLSSYQLNISLTIRPHRHPPPHTDKQYTPKWKAGCFKSIGISHAHISLFPHHNWGQKTRLLGAHEALNHRPHGLCLPQHPWTPRRLHSVQSHQYGTTSNASPQFWTLTNAGWTREECGFSKGKGKNNYMRDMANIKNLCG